MLMCFRCYYRRNGSSGVFNQIKGMRSISSSEIATALRPFYFVVHPDLFGQHPEQRSVNEESLKNLSAHIEALQQKRSGHVAPKELPFYVRHSDVEKRDTFKLVKISLGRSNDTKVVIKRILESCNLPTDYVDKIKAVSKADGTSNSPFDDLSRFYDIDENSNQNPFRDINFSSDFVEFEKNFRARKENEEKTLKGWLNNNVSTAHERSKGIEELKEEVYKQQEEIVKRLGLVEVRYDCGWNFEHYRGCLKTLERLANLHEKHMHALKGRVVVFAPFTGVSREGHIMLYTGDVLNNWIDFIRNIPKHDVYLKRIPAYEIALSQVLRDIKIGRRKFMPKAQAGDYAGHLRKVTTTLLDYLSTKKYPKSWPESLSEYEIVIESEAGPLMVSPTGQFIAPSTCPGVILVDFITNHLGEAKEKTIQYDSNKYIERELHGRCINQLELQSLNKDDSVTPDKMIKCLNRLLTQDLKNLVRLNLNITNYYSVLSDGTVCIPWDWKD
ncbi:unnamed protein product [Hermetia illucens]|uniref:T-cell activation inhibitor, mitochondrial n=1 Tax=Hermetia illucens TaxID=343691 RepID=A0A7R8YN38_HERIL|nr:T-cell activation inhibitor, mitochondrial [Hermetia illucens]CAD7078871.1 unnamed protein product [Hermetia illucens]